MPPRARHRAPATRGPRHAAPAPSRRAAAANATAYRQQRATAAASQGRPVPYGYVRGSRVQVARPEPVVIQPQETARNALKGTPRVLIAEFLICLVLIAAKPFEKAGEDAKLSEGTLGQFAAVMILFFFLALFGGISDRTQKAANLFGGLVTLGILFKNTESLAAVANAVNAGVKTPSTPAKNAGGEDEGSAGPVNPGGPNVTVPGQPAGL
jgi:hypothetical protein